MVVSGRRFDSTGHLHLDPTFEISHTVVVPQLVILYGEKHRKGQFPVYSIHVAMLACVL